MTELKSILSKNMTDDNSKRFTLCYWIKRPFEVYGCKTETKENIVA